MKRFSYLVLATGWLAMLTGNAVAAADSAATPAAKDKAPSQMEVTADQSLEWYQDKGLYVARGNAKAVRGDLVVTSDTLAAHERPKPDNGGQKATPANKSADAKDPQNGDIDKMYADGHVVVTRGKSRISGDHAVNDVDRHVMVVTGNNLRYETDSQIVTARDSLEYWDELKLAVARGHAVAIKGDRRVEGDILTAEFRSSPAAAKPDSGDSANNGDQLTKMTALGNVTVTTKNDITRGDKAVYDAAHDIAIITGHVRITRQDGTQLTGDVGESDFAANQSRLMNDGSGRVRALLPAKTAGKAGQNSTAVAAP